jgi:hypothetical protein
MHTTCLCFVGYGTLLEHLGPRQVFCGVRYPSEVLGSTPGVLWGTLTFWSTWVHAKCFLGYATLLEHLGPRQVFCGVHYPSGALGSTPGVLWGTLSFWSTWVHARCFVRFVLCVVFSRLLFVLSPFFIWSLYHLSFYL